MLDEHLLSIGQRTAEQRAAYLILFLFSRAELRGMTNKTSVEIPITQRHLADALGLSLVHTNRVLNRLSRRNAIKWHNHTLRIIRNSWRSSPNGSRIWTHSAPISETDPSLPPSRS